MTSRISERVLTAEWICGFGETIYAIVCCVYLDVALAADGAHDHTLALADDVQQGNVGGTAVKAAAAFDAILGGVVFQGLQVPGLAEPVEKEGLQPHRACVGAAPATDAGGFGSATGNFFRKIKY